MATGTSITCIVIIAGADTCPDVFVAVTVIVSYPIKPEFGVYEMTPVDPFIDAIPCAGCK